MVSCCGAQGSISDTNWVVKRRTRGDLRWGIASPLRWFKKFNISQVHFDIDIRDDNNRRSLRGDKNYNEFNLWLKSPLPGSLIAINNDTSSNSGPLHPRMNTTDRLARDIWWMFAPFMTYSLKVATIETQSITVRIFPFFSLVLLVRRWWCSGAYHKESVAWIYWITHEERFDFTPQVAVGKNSSRILLGFPLFCLNSNWI